MSDIHQLMIEARQELRRAMSLSKQGSYERRAPDAASLPHFATAQDYLISILAEDGGNRDALLMMSQLREALLDFGGAIACLSRAIDAGEPKTKKVLKRLALLRESHSKWQELGISPDSLRELGQYLESHNVGPKDRTLDLTRHWLETNCRENAAVILEGIRAQGAYSDFQVLANLVHG